MIVLDIETSGLGSVDSGICEIGAIDIYNPKNTFFQECRIDDGDLIQDGALAVNGKSAEGIRDKNKQSQKQLLINFFKWCDGVKIKNCICQNPQFDLGFIFQKARKYSLFLPINFRCFDMHSIAQVKYFNINGKFLINEKGNSGMNLTEVLKFVGMQDNRIIHNALEDVRLTAECFYRIFYGKNLFSEFEIFAIPDYLKKDVNVGSK